ncbi:MAG: hypothetical protein ACRDR6_16195 [Pseudonocardiaceae bacterium]
MTASEAPRYPERQLCDEPPLCDEAEFAAEVEGLVADFAPRLFALVEEAGVRVDGRIVAWGMTFEDHADVVGVLKPITRRFRCAERAHQAFSRRGKIRLIWYNPDAATRYDGAT